MAEVSVDSAAAPLVAVVLEDVSDTGWAYMSEIIVRASESAVTSISVALISMSGHMPDMCRTSVSKDTGIISPVRGRAIRFVSRKCIGKELKYRYAIGPVVIWHEIDRVAVSQIHLSGPLNLLPWLGQKSRSHGYMNAIPPMAAYDSWKPTSRSA